MNANFNPLTAPPPAEIPLPEAPLVRVIAQVRFLPILMVERREFIAPLQEDLRNEYPLFSSDSPTRHNQQTTVWRFMDTESQWRASLAFDFAALETTAYISRQDFIARFERFLSSVSDHIQPQLSLRLGLRYIDRIENIEADALNQLVRPEVVGLLSTEIGGEALSVITHSLFELPDEEAKLQAKWGQVPPNGTIDPSAIEPIPSRSWLLDIDIYDDKQHRFDVEGLTNKTRRLAERLYTFFRWVVTEDFLRRYGGQI